MKQAESLQENSRGPAHLAATIKQPDNACRDDQTG